MSCYNVLYITLLMCVTYSLALKPLIVTTWDFEQAGQKGKNAIQQILINS